MLTPTKQAPKDAKEKADTKRLARCGRCTNCKSQDCGNCYNCADKPKFGGPGIKKQACINRKCLLMVPRDEDGEKLARKRAKQRALPPAFGGRLPLPVDELALLGGHGPLGLQVQTPSSPPRSHHLANNNGLCRSPRSDTASPILPLSNGGLDSNASAAELLGAAAAAQALSEQTLFSLALDDDYEARGNALTSAMLSAHIQTPNASPVRRSETTHSMRAAAPAPIAIPPSAIKVVADGVERDPKDKDKASAAMQTLRKELDLEPEEPDAPPSPKAEAEGGGASAAAAAAALAEAAARAQSEALSQAFKSHIARLELMEEPIKPPKLDELHEEFLLLNAEHRRHWDEAAAPAPILAY